MARIFVSGLIHETHSFVPDITGLDQFICRHGAEITARAGDGSQMDGFLEVAAAEGWTVIPAADYDATPSGPVDHAVFETFWSKVEQVLRPALREGIDGIFLSLHGAMLTTEELDPEGELLARIRSLRGARSLPLFGVFDLHAVFTARMAALSDGLAGYRENPHTDARESAVRGARFLARSLSSGLRPRTYWRHPPIVWPPTGTGTADSPMADLERLARRIEAESPQIWGVNVVGGFAFADTPDTGVSFTVIATAPAAQAETGLDRLEALAWKLRAQGLPAEWDIDAALDQIDLSQPGPAVLVEPSDNIGGGAAGDGTGILRALVRRGVPNAAVVINDPEAVAALAPLAAGGRMQLAIGGKRNRFDAGPLALAVELLSRSDGRFTLEDRQSHMAGARGVSINMGPCATVRHAGVTILLTSRRTAPFDLGQLRSQGIEPSGLSVIGVKAAVAHRRAYDKVQRVSFTVNTPGPCGSDLTALPYRRLIRPVFPLDPMPDRQPLRKAAP